MLRWAMLAISATYVGATIVLSALSGDLVTICSWCLVTLLAVNDAIGTWSLPNRPDTALQWRHTLAVNLLFGFYTLTLTGVDMQTNEDQGIARLGFALGIAGFIAYIAVGSVYYYGAPLRRALGRRN